MAEEENGFEMDNNWLRNTFKLGVPKKMFVKGMKNAMCHASSSLTKKHHHHLQPSMASKGSCQNQSSALQAM